MDGRMRLPDSRGSRAVLVGTADYLPARGFGSLPAVATNLAELAGFLRSSTGLLPANVAVMMNPTGLDDIIDVLRPASESATDLLLFYFAGHGVALSNDLGLTHTGSRSAEPEWTTVPFKLVRQVLRDSSAAVKLVILDCCNSARAFGADAMGVSDDSVAMRDLTEISGTYVLTATNRKERFASALGVDGCTAFTGTLLQVLRGGSPGSDPYLTMEQTFKLLRSRLRATNYPIPQASGRDNAADIALTRSVVAGDLAPAKGRPVRTPTPRLIARNVAEVRNTRYAVSATIPVGKSPEAVAINVAARTAYVVDNAESTVSVIDMSEAKVIRTISKTAVGSYGKITVDPVNHRAYSSGYRTVSVVDLLTDTVIATIPVGECASELVLESATRTGYVSNFADGTVSVIDIDSNSVSSCINVGNKPMTIVVDPSIDTVYILASTDRGFPDAKQLSDYVMSIVNTNTNKVIRTIPVGKAPGGHALYPISHMSHTLYLYYYYENKIRLFDTMYDADPISIQVGSGPTTMLMEPASRTLYVGSFGGTVSVIDATTNTVSEIISVGSNPQRLALNLVTKTLFVANALSGTVSIIDLLTNVVSQTITVGLTPYDIGIDPVTDAVYVVNYGDSTVSVLKSENQLDGL
jgi:YVTN family beta-propeller protein